MTRKFTLILLCILFAFGVCSAREYNLFVGTYTDTVYVFRFDDINGTLKLNTKIDGVKNPSYLTYNGTNVYAVSETNGETPGVVVALRFGNKGLAEINRVSSKGDDPCYIDTWGNMAVVGNYSSGNWCVYDINGDGSLGEAKQMIVHKSKNTNATSQQKSHVHCTKFSHDGQQIWVADLGLEEVAIYNLKKGMVDTQNVARYTLTPGSGPRHLEFHPTKPYVYLLNEKSGAIVVMAQNRNGEILQIQNVVDVNLKRQDESTGVASADIHITPNGKFLYASHRGLEDSITIYSIGSDGKLSYVGSQSTLGLNPRNFAISPNGHFLLVANALSNDIVVMSINQTTGLLSPLPTKTTIQRPVCLKF